MPSLFSRFKRDERGNIALMFALMVIPLVGIVGLSVDSARAYAVRSQIQQALDAAALAGGRLFALPAAQRDTMITNFFNQNLQSTRFGATLSAPLNILANQSAGTLRVTAGANMPTTLMKVLGFNTVPVGASAQIERKEESKLEAAMVVDVSGSMDWLDSSGVWKMGALRNAMKLLVDTLYKTNAPDPNVQISIVPWNDSSYPASALVSPNKFLLAGQPFGFPGFLLPDLPSPLLLNDDLPLGSLKASSYVYGNLPVMPLDYKPALIKNFINTLYGYGATGSPVGIFWGWRTISPKWKGEWKGVAASLPRDHTEPHNVKAMILMTDGVNNTLHFNSTFYYWNTAGINALSVAQCTAMKAQGIRIYTIGFDLTIYGGGPSGPAATMLKTCATSPAMFFYSASSAALTAAFQAIASDLASLRLTN